MRLCINCKKHPALGRHGYCSTYCRVMKYCKYCNILLDETNTKKTNAGNLYSYCRSCYYKNTLGKNKKRNCKTCNKYLDNLKVEYCDLRCKFMFHVKKDNNNCFIWKGCSRNNHPTFSVKKTSIRSARKWAFYIIKGYDISILNHIFGFVCPLSSQCVNPDHINIHFTPEKIKIINELFDNGWNYQEIARHISIPSPTIRNYIHKRFKSSTSDHSTPFICVQCHKTHENIGTEFCSIECMNNYLMS